MSRGRPISEPTLGDLFAAIASMLSLQQIEMPKRQLRHWHELFYDLKTSPEPKPSAIRDMFFDWDGPYPKSSELADILQGLHSTANISSINPSYSRFRVPKVIADLWHDRVDELAPQDKDFVTRAAELARERFG